MSTKTASRQPDIWDELKAADKFSASTMQTILDFLNQLWWAPELVSMHGLNITQAEELSLKIAQKLWPLNDRVATSPDISPDKSIYIGPIVEKLKSEISEAEASGEARESFDYLTAMGCVAEHPYGLRVFKRHVQRSKPRPQCTQKPADASVVPPEPEPTPQKATGKLSHNQAQAFDRCVQMGQLFFSQRRFVKGFTVRSFPLIAGPTGAGKSHLVRQVAEQLGCEYVRLDYGTWLPRGAKEDPNTMESIAEKALGHERVLVHLDELDKLRGNFSSGWETSVLNDVWKLLDRPIELGHLAVAQSYEEGEAAFAKLFAERVWIVGSGTWQEIFETQHSSVGFSVESSQKVETDTQDSIKRIRERQIIPPELIARFDSKIQILGYPSAEEVLEQLDAAGMVLNDQLRHQLYENLPHSGFRAVEDLVTEYSLQCMANEAEPIALPSTDKHTEASAPKEDSPSSEIYTIALHFAGPQPKVAPPREAKVRDLPDDQIELDWQQLACGKSLVGLVRAHESIPHTQIWDAFAKDWNFPALQKFPRKTARAWGIDASQTTPPIREYYTTDEKVYEFWKLQTQASPDIAHEAEVEQVVEIIQAQINDNPNEEPSDTRQKLSHELVIGSIFKKLGQPGYVGANLTELRWQCERYVNEGLYFLYRQIEPQAWTHNLQSCFKDWEQRLIEHVIGKIRKQELICQRLQTPRSIEQFFQAHSSELEWTHLTEPQRAEFQQSLLPRKEIAA